MIHEQLTAEMVGYEWFVYRGEHVVAGPFKTKDDAQRWIARIY